MVIYHSTTKISIQFYNNREDLTKQLVSETHELFSFEVVSGSNRSSIFEIIKQCRILSSNNYFIHSLRI